MRWVWVAPVLLAAALAARPTAVSAKGARPDPKGGAPKAAGPVELRGLPIRDLPTTVSVPVSADLSLVLPLTERFWVQCPRHLPVPTSLDGQGLIVQYMNPRGGSVTMLYAGSVPLGPALDGDAPDARASRAAADFAAMLAQKYARVDWTLTSAPVTLAPATLKVDGKKVPGWRTARYTSKPREFAGPDSVFVGECVLLHPEGTDVLVYVALDAKAGGTTLDKAIERMAFKPTRGLFPAGRRLQLNDIALAEGGRFPVRLMAFDLPAGFAPTPALAALTGEWVYVEERLPAAGGASDAVLRIEQRTADPAQSVEQDAATEHAIWPEADRTALEAVDLSVRGHKAYLFSHGSPADGPAAHAHTAVLRLDDQWLTLTWVCRGGAEQAAQDRLLFVALLRSIEMAVRW